MRSILLTAFFLSPLFGCTQSPYEISQENVNRIVSQLASDELRGRRAFSPDIEKAAEFIASEYKSIGLETLEGKDDFRQEFSMYSLSPAESEFNIDGYTVEQSEYFVYSDSREVSVYGPGNVVYISGEDNFRSKFSEYNDDPRDLIVLVDTSHRPLFERYKAFFGNSRRTSELGVSSSQVYHIYIGDPPAKISLRATFDVKEEKLANVAGMIPGNRADEYILFSAHYDHIGIQQPVEGDSIANGANDNASGTTAVIELARYYASRGVPERTLLFVAFTAEEMGGYGSSYFSKQLDPDEIVAMFNIEMIGKPAVEGPNTAWITGFDKSDFGELLQKSVEGSVYTFYADPYPTQNLFYRSDNATLARLGVPAHTISTTPIDVDKDYHRVTDEVSTLDLQHTTNTINAIAVASAKMVSGEQTPKRVDPENVD